MTPIQDVDRSEEVEELLDLSDPKCHGLIQACIDDGKPLPIVGYAMGNAEGIVIAEAELAWETHRVAVLLEENKKAQEAFKEAGWTVFLADELSANPDPLLTVLGGSIDGH